MFGSHRREEAGFLSIPLKANKVLQIVLCALIIIAIRLWHLAVIQHEKKVQEAFKPRRKVAMEPAARGTIRDRFNTVLAANKIEYRLAIVYSQFRDIPAWVFIKDENGNKKKRFVRKEYITKLSKLLAKELNASQERIEDLIYSHASLNNHIPLVLKRDLKEEQYFRLKALEKDWVGLELQIVPKRYYPYGRSGADVIGYMGAIQKNQYSQLVNELRTLSDFVRQKELGYEVDLPEGISSFADVKKKLFELEEKAYTINDDVGRTGIEASFEESLRGYSGKKIYFSDAKGNALREMPGSRPALPGKRVLLSMSIELQEFAEMLLAQSEIDREKAYEWAKAHTEKVLKEPWMKGGAIVAMVPSTGEVVALASYPRYDLNDFVKARSSFLDTSSKQETLRWLENENYVARVWNQFFPLKREVYSEREKKCIDETRWLTWDFFLELILPLQSTIQRKLNGQVPLKKIIALQHAFSTILQALPEIAAQNVIDAIFSAPEHVPITASNKQFLKNIHEAITKKRELATSVAVLNMWLEDMPSNKEKLLLLDLTRLIINQQNQSDELSSILGGLNVATFRELSCGFAFIQDFVKSETKKAFHELSFAHWKEKNSKVFLQNIRLQEKNEKRATRPYLEYVDKEESRQFEEFWLNNGQKIVLALLIGKVTVLKENQELAGYAVYFAQNKEFFEKLRTIDEALKDRIARVQGFIKKLGAHDLPVVIESFESYKDLTFPLYFTYRGVPYSNRYPNGQDLVSSFLRVASPGYARSWAFRQSTAQGSIFKLVTAYAALKQRYHELQGKLANQETNFFEIIDRTWKQDGKIWVGSYVSGQAIPQIHKGGRIPKSVRANNGRCDLLKAMEVSSNPYFALLASEYLKDPDVLIQAAYEFGYGQKSGINLPGEIPGKVPHDVSTNKTGLYAFAIGQHSLVTTPLQGASMLCTIANGGSLLTPKIVNIIAGKSTPFAHHSLTKGAQFPYKESLESVGIHFPAFIEPLGIDSKNEVYPIQNTVRRKIFMPPVMRKILCEGMNRVVVHVQAERTGALGRFYQSHPYMLTDFLKLRGQFIGKTSTAESQERIGIDIGQGTTMYNHTWFGGISFDPESSTYTLYDSYGKPELVVVVYLRYGGYGKEVAPIGAQIIKKWREIQNKHRGS